jgi:hypothetical protein
MRPLQLPKFAAPELAALLALSACATGGSGEDSSNAAVASGNAVDTERPTFSNPTAVTNPLFPTSETAQVIQLGTEGGRALRVEVTLLPSTRTIEWDGDQVEVVEALYIAYGDGRLLEVTLDFFAQADDGSVWYFGEEVDNYEGGAVSDHGGAWLAGRDGPPGMIMPADPQVGDVFRPENIPGLVFEEDIVKSTGETVDGPRGPVEGAIRVEEHLMEGTSEQKIWAPGYGEFQIEAGDEMVKVAVAVPIDASSDPAPEALVTLLDQARALFDAATREDHDAISEARAAIEAAWGELEGSDLPPLLAEQLGAAVEATATEEVAEARQAAVAVFGAALDVELLYEEVATVDRGRLEWWARQLIVDAAAADEAGAASDVASLQAIRRRLPSDLGTAGQVLDDLASAVESGDMDALGSGAEELITALNSG